MTKSSPRRIRSANGWSFNYFISGSQEFADEHCGICMQAVSNQGHHFAEDIRLCQIWINPGLQEEKRLTLGLNDFNLVETAELPAIKQQPPKPFNAFPTLHSLSATYVTKDAIYPGSTRLKVVQSYVLTDYSATPAHEPGGVLTAARIFPMFHFSFVNGPDPMSSSERILSVRFDLRLNLQLDLFLNNATPRVALMELIGRIPKHREYEEVFSHPQQLGLFKDADTIDKKKTAILGAAILSAKELSDNEKSLEQNVDETASLVASLTTFQNVEKPTVLEVIGQGLRRGDWRSGPKDERVLWDNVHWWGGFDWTERKKQDPTIIGIAKTGSPSTPGGAHAAHFHWRWGLVLQEGFPGAPYSGDPQFIGAPIGGPLIDPAIPDQDIRFAAVLCDIASMEQTTSEFGKDFRIARDASERAVDANSRVDQPLPIAEGGDVVLYASCEVHQQQGKVFEGTVFPQGIFFAHESEKAASFEVSGKDNRVGVRTALYWTKKRTQIEQAKQWAR